MEKAYLKELIYQKYSEKIGERVDKTYVPSALDKLCFIEEKIGLKHIFNIFVVGATEDIKSKLINGIDDYILCNQKHNIREYYTFGTILEDMTTISEDTFQIVGSEIKSIFKTWGDDDLMELILLGAWAIIDDIEGKF